MSDDAAASAAGPTGPPAHALAALAEALVQAAGSNLHSLVLYGGVARGSWRPGASDVDVALVLEDTSAASLAAIAPALREGWRAARIEPLILRRAELPALLDTFPTRLLDIQACHRPLAGADPFRDLQPDPRRVALRVEQAIRNLALRLRRRYVAAAGDAAEVASRLAAVARPLAAELAPLLRLAGRHPGSDDTAALLAAAATVYGLDAGVLARLAAARKAPGAEVDAEGLAEGVLRALDAAAEAVRKVGEGA